MVKKAEIDEGELGRLHKRGMTQGEMATYFGCSRWTIGRQLRKLGICTGLSGKHAHGWKGGERLDNRDGYVEVLQPGHPRANAEGYVRRSVLMWEAFHDKPFPEDREPHHMDGDPTNDSPGNILSLLHSEHSLLEAWIRHERGRFAKEGA